MKKVNTKIKATLVACAIAFSGSIYAEERNLFANVEYNDTKSIGVVDNIVSNPLYQELEFDEDIIRVYKLLEKTKLTKPTISNQEVVQLLDRKIQKLEKNDSKLNQFSTNNLVYESYEEWTKLNNHEKILIASNPTYGLITAAVQKTVYTDVRNEYGYNGLGDESDAFRHAILNAYLCKFTSDLWANAITTAHEIKSHSELQQINPQDGHYEYEHQAMDLHNNAEGRDVWYWYDTLAITKNSTLRSRVKQKIFNGNRVNGQLYWFN